MNSSCDFFGQWRVKLPAYTRLILSIMIFLPLEYQKQDSNYNGCCFCCRNRDPDAVQAQEQGQEQYGQDLENQRPQERNQGGSKAVSQGGKKGGAEDGESCKQERKGEEEEAPQCHFQKRLIISYK